MLLWGNQYSKRDIQAFCGDSSQFFGVRKAVLDDGPGRGMRCWEIRTGAGLSFAVLPDRGMDIGWCEYQSIPVAFISKTGPVAPSLCEYGGNRFLRGFTGGLLTTCGYTHMGAACTDNGEELGLHGRASMLAADHTSAAGVWVDDDYLITISGLTREASTLGENLQMHREIRVKCGENKINILDRVENCGFSVQPLMLLYHFNFGHPLLGPHAKFHTSHATQVKARDSDAQSGIDHCQTFGPPTPGYKEQVFYHSFPEVPSSSVFAGLVNPQIGLSVKIGFDLKELPYLIQWKQTGQGDYVCGIEPATWYPEGRSAARERGELTFLQPGESKRFHTEVSFAEC